MRARTTIGESDIAGLLAGLLRKASPPIRIETVNIAAGALTLRGKAKVPVPIPFTAVITPEIADGGLEFDIELAGVPGIVRRLLLDRLEDKISKLPGLRRIGDRIRWEAGGSFGSFERSGYRSFHLPPYAGQFFDLHFGAAGSA
ncbi:MAG TPA: hypothetical protein PK636_09850, partial [bacterium]|nr:hypothetical protein [bacterium]